MNKHVKKIHSKNSFKVSKEEKSMDISKSHQVIGSEKAHKAYIVKAKTLNDVPLELSFATFDDEIMQSARVVEDSNQLEAFLASNRHDVETIEIPAGSARETL